MNFSLVTIEDNLDSLTPSFWHNLGLKYRQISQLWADIRFGLTAFPKHPNGYTQSQCIQFGATGGPFKLQNR